VRHENGTCCNRNLSPRMAGVTGVILAGGNSSRMGSNKALLPYCGGRFIEAIYRQMVELFHEVLLVYQHPRTVRLSPLPEGG